MRVNRGLGKSCQIQYLKVMIKLIAIDLDDTLLRTDLTISHKNRAALRAAEEKGVRLVLASGRSLPSMKNYSHQLGLHDKPGYLISDNGSTISSTSPFQVLVSHTLNKALLDELFDAFAELGLPVQVYQDKTILVTFENQITLVDVKLSGYERHVVPDLKHSLTFQPAKLVIPGDPEFLKAALVRIRKDFGTQVNSFISKPYFLEVLPLAADKGTALAFVAQQAGISPEHIMAIGDAANDLGMIKFAGWGVAMANAIPDVKAVARIISQADHEDDGVAEILEQYVLST